MTFNSPGLTIIGNGNYNATTANTGTVTGGQLDQTDSAAATAQLGTLIGELASVSSGLPASTLGANVNANTTLYPGINYNSGSGIAFGSSNPITLTLDAQGNANGQFFIKAVSAITFKDVTFVLLNGANPLNIFWYAPSGITNATSTGQVPGIFISNSATVSFSTTGTVINGRVYVYSSGQITFPATSTVIFSQFPCYAKGTKILTEKGYVLVEDLKKEDKIYTNGRIYNNKGYKKLKESYEPVKWIGSYKPENLDSESRPICIKQDAFGKNVPNQDLYVSPDHGFIVNHAFVPAKRLVNDKTVFQDKECQEVEYFHIELDKHSIINANGMQGESFLNVNNKYVFTNN